MRSAAHRDRIELKRDAALRRLELIVMCDFINAPWKIEAPIASEHLQIRDSTGRIIAAIAGTYPTSPSTEDKHANLMCAAPDLYEALKNILSRVANDADSCTWFCKEQEEAIKALAKARGEYT